MKASIFPRGKRVAGFIAVVLVIATLSMDFATSDAKPAARRAKRVLVISLDGLDARYLRKRDDLGLKIPNLRRLLDNGVMARGGVISVYPSLTYPAHTTIVTGALPARHGIFGNEIFDPPNRPRTGAWNWFASDIWADTLWDTAKRSNMVTAMVSWPVSAGAGDYNFPEIYKSGWSQKETFQRARLNARPAGLVEQVEAKDRALFSAVTADETDDMRTRFAEYIISTAKPDFMLVHLFDLDHFEHDFGPFTPEAFAMLEKVDGYVGRILSATERAGTLDDTAVFIVSDHGFMPVSKSVYPGVLLAKAGLITTREETDANGKARTVVTDWLAAPYATAGSCSIILRDPNDIATLNRVRAIFKPLQGEKGSGIYRVIEKPEIRALGGNPRAAIMLDAEAGCTFGNVVSGEFIVPTKQKGQHGYLPTRPDFRASFIASGAGITRRRDLGEIRMIDVGPTIANSVGLTLRNAQGRALGLRK